MAQAHSHGLEDWIAKNPSVKTWFDRLSRKRRNTGRIFGFNLWKYWKEHLAARGYHSAEEWAREVKSQVKNEDVQVSRKWARGLEAWSLSESS